MDMGFRLTDYKRSLQRNLYSSSVVRDRCVEVIIIIIIITFQGAI